MEEQKTEEVKVETPIETVQSPVASTNIIDKYRKLIVLFGVFLVGIVIILAIGFLGNKLVGKLPPPEPENILLATVGDKMIYRNDVKKIASTQYTQSAIDSRAMKLSLDIAVERAILEQEAVRLGFSLVSEAQRDSTYYAKIKEQVINGKISKITATQIGWWVPPPAGYPRQIPLYDTQRAEGERAVVDIKTQFTQNIPVIEILKNVYVKYPSLQSIISINGTRYTGQTNADGLSITREYDYDKSVSYFPKNKLMIGMNEGEVKSAIWDDKSGAVVIKVIKITKGEKIGYSEWLQEKIKSTVK